MGRDYILSSLAERGRWRGGAVTEGAVRVGRSTLKRARQLRREMTPPEVLLWAGLKVRRDGWPSFRRQHPVGPYVLDFYCAGVGLCVEVDGLVHGLGDRPERDEMRDHWLAGQGIEVLRVAASEVMRDAQEVAGWIWARVEGMMPASGREVPKG